MNNRGFTLIELILVITIIAITAVVALPSFIDVRLNAEAVAKDGVAGAVQTGIVLYQAKDLLDGGFGGYPAALDSVGANRECSAANPCFTEVLTGGLTDESWLKVNDREYQFSYGDNFAPETYKYDPNTGLFTLQVFIY